MGKKAAMACTIAVEEVIDDHYAAQIEALGDGPEEAQLAADLEVFRQEEVEHRDIGIDHGGQQAPGYPLLRTVIRRGCKTAIWLSERI
jgi:ubiquinone biosynthesis monooxygenase Coq7